MLGAQGKHLAYEFIVAISKPFLSKFRINEELTADQIPWVAFFFTILMLMGLGVMATNVLGRKIISMVENLVERVPLVATIYNAVKQIIESIQHVNVGTNFKRVAYVEYPSEECRLIGFVTGQYYDKALGQEVTAVFLPTAPNPMTGFVLLIPTEKVIESDLGLEEASRMILSAGLASPKSPPMEEAPVIDATSRGGKVSWRKKMAQMMLFKG